jgi:DNA-binding transcriptional LysR family regulator
MACSIARFVPTISCETADYAVTAPFVAKGFGIALVPELACPPSAEPAVSCMEIHVVGEPIVRQISLAHRTSEHSQIIQELFNDLRANLE